MNERQIENLIKEKLARIEAPEDRSFVKEVVENGLLALLRHNEDLVHDLETRILDEINQKTVPYDVYTTVIPRNAYDETHSYLQPVLEEDITEAVFDMAAIESAVVKTTGSSLFRVYLDCDYLTIRNHIETQKVFPAKIKHNGGEIEAGVKLQRSSIYIEKAEALYRQFIGNKIRWTTLNCPYFFKFYDVCLASAAPLPQDAKVSEIEVDFGELTPYVRRNFIPLWNIRLHQVKSAGFAEPIIDRVSYQHTVPVQVLGSESGYLIDPQQHDFDQVRRMGDELVVVCDKENVRKWNLIQVIAPKIMETEKLPFAVFHNKRTDGYAKSAAESGPTVIRTRGELFRYTNAFSSNAGVQLKSVEVLLDNNIQGETYDANPFLSDEIRVGSQANTLLLSFTCEEPGPLARDIMSFLTSEAAMYYPEYRCVGVLL